MAEERDEADLDDDTDVSCFFSCCMIQKHVENLRSDEEKRDIETGRASVRFPRQMGLWIR